MSGGVDSSAAAWLLKQEGYDVIGVTMEIWQNEDMLSVEENGGCCGLTAVEDARRVAETIGIPHYVMNFRKDFQKHVIDYFIDAYTHGRTPNPCIACNRYVKWEALLRRSLEIGADYIATGHYARIVQLPNGRYAVKKSVTEEKDQTYALYNLTQEQLSRTLMPAGAYTKDEIRAMADRAGLPVAHKPDSQEICFVPDDDYAGFITANSSWVDTPGNFVDRSGKVLGQHKGIIHYTVGQRKGLGLAFGEPVFVIKTDPENNTVVLGKNDDLFYSHVKVRGVNWISGEAPGKPINVQAKLRYRQQAAPALLVPGGKDKAELVFVQPQRAPAPGQAAVFYDRDEVLGGGTIEHAF